MVSNWRVLHSGFVLILLLAVPAFGQPGRLHIPHPKAENYNRDPLIEAFETMLSNKDGMRNIELLPEQLQDLSKPLLKTYFWGRDNVRSYDTPEEFARVYHERLVNDLEKALLPHQLDILKASALKKAFKAKNVPKFVDQKWFRDLAGISGEQHSRIRDRIEREQKKLKEIIERATKEAEGRILSELNAKQQMKIKQFVEQQHRDEK